MTGQRLLLLVVAQPPTRLVQRHPLRSFALLCARRRHAHRGSRATRGQMVPDWIVSHEYGALGLRAVEWFRTYTEIVLGTTEMLRNHGGTLNK